MASPDSRSKSLGAFLRARRSELSPDDVGLAPAPRRRRVAGLRREEVAMLAALSPDYYTRLEQGRLRGASPSALRSLGAALRLTPDQLRYLFELAGKDLPEEAGATPEVHPHLRRLVDTMTETPVLVLDRTMQILGWNDLAVEFYTDFAALPAPERNLLRLIFLHPQVRHRYVDWHLNARECVAFLRMDAARSPESPRVRELIREISAVDEDFRRWWDQHDVISKTLGRKRFRHPATGVVELDWQFLSSLHDPDHSLMVLSAEPGSTSAAKLHDLARSRSAAGTCS